MPGKFEPSAASLNDNDGFDKLGAYGYDNTAKKYRFLLDFDHDGVSDLSVVSAFQVNAIPVAGNFAPNHPGDEIGLLMARIWYLDTVGDNQLHVKIASNFNGRPIVGDFNGDGSDDLATYDAGTNTFYFDTNRDGIADDDPGRRPDQWLHRNARRRRSESRRHRRSRPLGPRSPRQPHAEHGRVVLPGLRPHWPDAADQVFDQVRPTPLGNDVFAQFGDHFPLPIFGNFDPPVAPRPVSMQNRLNRLDVDNNGEVNPSDVLAVINRINSGETAQLPLRRHSSAVPMLMSMATRP